MIDDFVRGCYNVDAVGRWPENAQSRHGGILAAASADKGLLMCLAIPGQVVEIVDAENRLAQVDVAGVRRNVNVALLEDGVGAGDWVLIHVGFALSKVDEEEAQATLQLLQQMGDAYEQELEDLKTSAIG
jgi:hydrogenase expression/formation protein HypC